MPDRRHGCIRETTLKRITALLLILLLPGIASASPIELKCTIELPKTCWTKEKLGVFYFTFDTDDVRQPETEIETWIEACYIPIIPDVAIMRPKDSMIIFEIWKNGLTESWEFDPSDLSFGDVGATHKGSCEIIDPDA